MRDGRLVRIGNGDEDGPPRYATGHGRLGFTTVRDENTRICLFDSTTSDPDWIAEIPGRDVEFDWSPDAERVVGTSQDGATSHVWIADAGGHQPFLLESTDSGRLCLPRWAATQEQIIVTHLSPPTASHPGRVEVLATSPQGRTNQMLVWNGPIHAMAVSPDEKALAVIGHPTSWGLWHNRQLWIVPLSGTPGPWQLGGSLDRSIGQVVRGDDGRGIHNIGLEWLPDGEGVVAVVADGGISSPYAFGLDGSVSRVIDDGRCHLELAVASASGAIATSWSSPEVPGEVSVYEGGTESSRTHLNNGWLEKKQLAETIPITTTTADGKPVEGWLTKPLPPNPLRDAPLAVQVHGGPHYPVGRRFSFDSQRLAGRGIAVLRVNPRGSQGYGIDFARAIVGAWGELDYTDLMTVIETAIEEWDLDSTRTAIFGESYGGYLTNHAITRTNRFSAAVAENSISDIAALASGPAGPAFWHLEFGGAPSERPGLYKRKSPLFGVEAIDTPLLMIHAEADTTCPISQTETMVSEMRRQGKSVEVVTIPDEDHWVNVFGSAAGRVTRIEALDGFLTQHLLPLGQ
ncbi:MAG: S9 family peptidase [Acidimicrobiia bacterium]|jgi:dipeptidyl aminopeptidase/acylaminoacyl peptidase